MSLIAELTEARALVEQGEFKHAAFHAALALSYDPNDARALALVDDLIDRPLSTWSKIARWATSSDDPAPLFPNEDFYGFGAVRARALWKRGEHDAAFGMLVDLQLAVPQVSYQGWMQQLLRQASEPLDARPLFRAFGHLANRHVGILHLRRGEQALFREWADLASRLVEKSTGLVDPMLAIAASGLLRRSGRYREARDVIARVHDHRDDKGMVLSQEGLAARALGDTEDARSAFAQALAETGDDTYELEIARALYDSGQHSEALGLFSRKVREDGETKLAIAACQWATGVGSPGVAGFSKVPSSYDALRRFIATEAGFVGMTDATTNGLNQFVSEHAEAEAPLTIKFTVNFLESPSVLLTLAVFTTGTCDLQAIEYEYEAMSVPDPRQPLTKDGALLWVIDGNRIRQALPRPSDATLVRISSLLSTPPLPTTELLATLQATGVDDIPSEELLAALTFPPRIPKGTLPAESVFTWQRTVALMLSQQRRDEPWAGSVRRRNLRSLLFGCPDWTTAAALLAFTEVLADEPEALDDARNWLDALVEFVPSQGHCPWATALAYLHQRTGGLRHDLLEAVAPWLEPSQETERGT